MTKSEYLQRLEHQLSFYNGNIPEIMQNYSAIIDELLDEGLSMDDVIRRLGRPASLADDIVEEFNLQYTEHYKEKTNFPTWAKIVLIIFAVIVGFPIIMSVLGTIIGIVFGIGGGLIGSIFGTFIAIFKVWDWPTATVGFKVLGSITGIFGLISILIIAYFFINFIANAMKFVWKQCMRLFNSVKGGF